MLLIPFVYDPSVTIYTPKKWEKERSANSDEFHKYHWFCWFFLQEVMKVF